MMIKTNEANEMKTVSSRDEFSKSFPEMENHICKNNLVRADKAEELLQKPE